MTTATLPTTICVRRISIVRLGLVIILLTGVGYIATNALLTHEQTASSQTYTPWFAGYVDVTSTPTYSFEKRPMTVTANDAVLAFIVASNKNPCEPTWGTYYTIDEAADSLDLDRRIARLQQQGGKIAISFGGALNRELALACTDEAALKAAYQSVISRYNVSTIDLDLERESLQSQEAGDRRARVIADLQKEYAAKGKNLIVWLTLPVAPYGLTKEGTDAVATMLKAGVNLAGVNVMTMDYGASKTASDTMYEAAEKALLATHRQLGILYQNVGTNLTARSLWTKLGATPMIGQNDVVDEVFTIEDATRLNQFALEKGLGRMSMWSANRDIPCGENYVDLKVVSDVCSGVTTPAYAFAEALGNGFTGDLMQQATMLEVESATSAVEIIDDPKTSPYEIWQENGIYLKGTKVVWRGNVYEAKWWTKNELPDNPVLQAFETPWQLIGPVLPTDKPMEQLVLPPTTFPAWSGRAVYEAGDRVLFEGLAFRAKWWNQGESPAAAAANPESSPWVPLTREQVQEVLKQSRGQ